MSQAPLSASKQGTLVLRGRLAVFYKVTGEPFKQSAKLTGEPIKNKG
jgi:hypothetical protein